MSSIQTLIPATPRVNPSRRDVNASAPGTALSRWIYPVGYLLRIVLRTTGPRETYRKIRVPCHTNFYQLHQIIQIAFEWADSHLHQFKITFPGVDPVHPQYPDFESLPDPSHVMTLMEKDDLDDGAGDMLCDEEYKKLKDSKKVTLRDIFENPAFAEQGMSVLYEYDFGDGWEHEIHLEGTSDQIVPQGEKRSGVMCQTVFCYEGTGHPPPEDCGGKHGWEKLKQLLTDPALPDPEGKREWYKGLVSNVEISDLNRFNMIKVNWGLRSNPGHIRKACRWCSPD